MKKKFDIHTFYYGRYNIKNNTHEYSSEVKMSRKAEILRQKAHKYLSLYDKALDELFRELYEDNDFNLINDLPNICDEFSIFIGHNNN